MDVLADRLNGQLDSWLTMRRGNVFAVLDVASQSVLEQIASDGVRVNQPLLHLPLTRSELPPELLPGLLPIDTGNWQLRQRTVRMALQKPVDNACPALCGWICSDLAPRSLTQLLASSMLRMSSTGRQYIFRHHDPRVRACLLALLGRRWLSQVLNVPHEWLWATSNVLLHLQAEEQASDAAACMVPPQREQQAIARCGEINRALQLAQDSGWEFDASAYAIADAALTSCEAWGFAGAADRLAFIIHSLTVAPTFDRHPPIEAALRAGASSAESYLEAAARIPADIWEAARG